MNKIFKLIGKRGRTTVPFEIRMKMRLGYNSLVSYELKDEDTLILRKEKIESFFSKDDNLITLHQRKVEKLQIMKKSMLEKMFV